MLLCIFQYLFSDLLFYYLYYFKGPSDSFVLLLKIKKCPSLPPTYFTYIQGIHGKKKIRSLRALLSFTPDDCPASHFAYLPVSFSCSFFFPFPSHFTVSLSRTASILLFPPPFSHTLPQLLNFQYLQLCFLLPNVL